MIKLADMANLLDRVEVGLSAKAIYAFHVVLKDSVVDDYGLSQ